jgi:hypothetical protein
MNLSFRTEIEAARSKWDIGFNTPVLFTGSCFSDNIGKKLSELKFPVLLNPFGVLYNPHSIARSIEMTIDNGYITENTLVKQNNLWHSLYFHGSFSKLSPAETAANCNNAIKNANGFLSKAAFLIVTFGTAWVYRYKQTGEIVANCHKIPNENFKRERLTITEITEQWKTLIQKLYNFNPNLKIIFTVSPVRHLKDGAHGNQLSKATLLLSIENIIKLLPGEQIGYFPSYEIINDDLRDYRFYDSDMIHISETGVNYIFDKFCKTYFSAEVKNYVGEILSIVKAYNHKLLTGDNETIRKFGEKMREKTEAFNTIFPNINFELEINHFKKLEHYDKGFS